MEKTFSLEVMKKFLNFKWIGNWEACVCIERGFLIHRIVESYFSYMSQLNLHDWSLNKMADILQKTISNAFSRLKYFNLKFSTLCSKGSN